MGFIAEPPEVEEMPRRRYRPAVIAEFQGDYDAAFLTGGDGGMIAVQLRF